MCPTFVDNNRSFIASNFIRQRHETTMLVSKILIEIRSNVKSDQISVNFQPNCGRKMIKIAVRHTIDDHDFDRILIRIRFKILPMLIP